jgi:ribose transport system substrate-binding protein
MKKSMFVLVSLVLGFALIFGVLVPTAIGGPKVAFMLPNVGPWYNDKWEGFRDEGTKLGFEMTMYNVGGYANVSKQVSQVEDVIRAGYDGIVLHATSGSALIPPVKKALKAGIVVSTEHSPLAEEIVPNVWEGPAEAGRISAMVLANAIGGEGLVFLLNGPPGQMESLAEEEAFLYTMKRYFPKVRVISENMTAESSTVMARTEDLLTAHPDVKGIKGWSGMHYAIGAMKALQGAGYKPGQVKIIASYSMPSDLENLKKGWYHALYFGAPVDVGRTSARIQAKMLKGEKVPMLINVPMVLIFPEMIGKWDMSGCEWGMK